MLQDLCTYSQFLINNLLNIKFILNEPQQMVRFFYNLYILFFVYINTILREYK